MGIDIAPEGVEVSVAGVQPALAGVEACAEGTVLCVENCDAMAEAEFAQCPLGLGPGVLQAERVEREVEDAARPLSDVVGGGVLASTSLWVWVRRPDPHQMPAGPSVCLAGIAVRTTAASTPQGRRGGRVARRR